MLHESLESLNRLLNSIVEGMYAVDTNGHCTFLNASCLQLLGYQSKDEVLGKHMHALMHHSHADGSPYPVTECRICRAYQTRQTIHLSDEVFWRKDGSFFPVEYWSSPIMVDGEAVGAILTFDDISERKKSEDELNAANRMLRKSQRLMESIVEYIPVMVFVKRASDLRFELFNRAAENLLGYSRSDLLGKGNYDFWPKEQADWFTAADTKVLASEGVTEILDEPINIGSGETRHLHTWKVALRDECGEPEHLLGISVDITDRKRAEEELRIAAATFDTHDGIMITDANANIIKVNNAFTSITGYTPEEVSGKKFSFMKSGRHDKKLYDKMFNSLQRDGKWVGEIWGKRKNGDIYPQWMTVTAIKNEQQKVLHYVSIFSDITDRKKNEELIKKLVFYDPLTQLPNRRILVDRLGQAMASNKRRGTYGAVMFMDVNKFKFLNDTHGHVVGDLLLIEVGRRIKSCIRDTDTIARFGGDEFVVILSELSPDEATSKNAASIVAEKILLILAETFFLKSKKDGDIECCIEHNCSSSIGVTLFNGHEANQESILNQADTAMYWAKEGGRHSVLFYPNT